MQIMSIENKGLPFFIFFSVIILFLITRFTNLTILPIYTDEAVYIRWAKMINEDVHNILLPIEFGNKKPLLMWLIAVSLNIFDDPLWAGRLISVLAGFFSLTGIYFIGVRIHSVWVGSISALLYTISPYYVFYDRIAHQAGLLNCFFIWLVLLTLIIFQQEERSRGKYYWALGLIIGLSLLTKVTSLLIVFLPLVFKLVFFRKKTVVPWKSLLLSYLVGLLIAVIPYSFLFLESSNYSAKAFFIPKGNSLGDANIADIFLQIPHNIFNLGASISYFTTYLTLPVFLLGLVFFIFQFKIFDKKYIIILLYFLVPFLCINAVRGDFSKYYLLCGSPILLWASLALYYGVDFLRKRLLDRTFYITIFLLLLILFSPSIVFSYKILINPIKAPLIGGDYETHIRGEHSGYGMPEAIEYFKEVSRDKKITIFTSYNWGNPADSIYVYLSDDPNINIYTAFWAFDRKLLPPGLQIINTMQKFTGKKMNNIFIDSLSDVYFICRSPAIPKRVFLAANKNFQLARSFRKPGSTVFVDIYKRTSS